MCMRFWCMFMWWSSTTLHDISPTAPNQFMMITQNLYYRLRYEDFRLQYLDSDRDLNYGAAYI